MSKMLIQRPYLLRAFYDWIVDSECTPHIIVDATMPQVEVPEQFVENGKIVLNIAPESIVAFSLNDEALSFNARFSGQPMQVYVPLYAIEGIYTQENGVGTMFPEEEAYKDILTKQASNADKTDNAASKKPTLTVVK